MSKFEVTNLPYSRFMRAIGRAAPVHPYSDPRWLDGAAPVTGVNWDDARADAEWAGAQLPTEIEWEKAARGVEGREFPWGAAHSPPGCDAVSDPEREPEFVDPPRKVGSTPGDESPNGCMDMATNPGEWCVDAYNIGDNDSRGPAVRQHALRANCMCNRRACPHRANERCAGENPDGSPGIWSYNYGFRCARSWARGAIP